MGTCVCVRAHVGVRVGVCVCVRVCGGGVARVTCIVKITEMIHGRVGLKLCRRTSPPVGCPTGVTLYNHRVVGVPCAPLREREVGWGVGGRDGGWLKSAVWA